MSTAEIAIAPEDRLRADLYNFIGLMLAGPPDQMLLDQCAGLIGDDTDLGRAISALAQAASVSTPKAVSRELTRYSSGWGGANFCPMPVII